MREQKISDNFRVNLKYLECQLAVPWVELFLNSLRSSWQSCPAFLSLTNGAPLHLRTALGVRAALLLVVVVVSLILTAFVLRLDHHHCSLEEHGGKIRFFVCVSLGVGRWCRGPTLWPLPPGPHAGKASQGQMSWVLAAHQP